MGLPTLRQARLVSRKHIVHHLKHLFGIACSALMDGAFAKLVLFHPGVWVFDATEKEAIKVTQRYCR